jgi:probable phosphoglycerate mutase
MAIYLIRHGETAGNAERVVQRPDIPLSPNGVEQARRLARRLASERIGLILSSDLARAAMTAEVVRETTGAPICYDALLQERNFGDLRGRSYAEIGFDFFAPDYEPPGGESWERFEARMDQAWALIQRVAEECQENLAVVTHGLVCRSVVARRTRLPEGVGQDLSGLPWRNTSLTILEGPDPWRIRLLDSSVHLDAAATPGRGMV